MTKEIEELKIQLRKGSETQKSSGEMIDAYKRGLETLKNENVRIVSERDTVLQNLKSVQTTLESKNSEITILTNKISSMG